MKQVNFENTKNMITSRCQNSVQNQSIVIKSLSFEKVEKFKYLGVTVTNTNDIREEIKRNKHWKCVLLFTCENCIVPPAFQEIES